MKYLQLITVPLMLAAGAHAETQIAFGPVRAQPGESVRLVSTSECSDGTVETTKDFKTSHGTIRFLRERDMSWTFREPTEDKSLRGMVSIANISTNSSVKMNGKEEKTEDRSPLCGKMFAITKSPAGEWKFELDGSIPQVRIHNEIDELTTYLKRRWYPERVVKLGDSWEFDPSWIRMIVEKDLKKAQMIGTMKLRQVRRTPKADIAVIDVSVRGTGGDFHPDGSETKAQLELSGQVMVNLKTMLDERLELKGDIVTSTGTVTETKKVTFPVNLVVTKSFVKGF
jgi:hypothetical protein